MKALIIEDNEAMANGIANWLSDVVDEVVIAYKMEDALREIERVPPPELVTIDLNLPDSHREATKERIVELRERVPNALMIVLTGVATISEEESFLKQGADGLIEKMEATSKKKFFARLQDIAQSLVGKPERFKNLAILDKISKVIVRDLQISTSRETSV